MDVPALPASPSATVGDDDADFEDARSADGEPPAATTIAADRKWVDAGEEEDSGGEDGFEDDTGGGDDEEDEYFAESTRGSAAKSGSATGAGAGPANAGAGSSDEAAPPSDGALPDLVLADGRIVSRRARARGEADDVPDDKKDAAMAGAMKEEGNRHFGAGTYDTAAACYTEALRHVPRASPEFDEQRAVYYANRGACYMQLSRLEEALYDLDRALEANSRYVKALARRSAVMERLAKLDEALADMDAWLAVEPGSAAARAGAARLRASVSERDEKLKAEMLGKLKEMGNWVLGKFGMSVDNFKAVQDPATGSYSISFQR